MKKQGLTLTQSLKAETVAEMLTRTAAHYPNSGHTPKTLKIVAEDWYYTFKGQLTDRGFIEAITKARRLGKFFPTEADIFAASGLNSSKVCKDCEYYNHGKCPNLKKEGYPEKCTAFSTVIRSFGG